jgi:hypothetical protein
VPAHAVLRSSCSYSIGRATLFAVLGASIYGFSLMPMFLAVGVVAESVFLFSLVLCIGAGDILPDFALEDERFFELATRASVIYCPSA